MAEMDAAEICGWDLAGDQSQEKCDAGSPSRARGWMVPTQERCRRERHGCRRTGKLTEPVHRGCPRSLPCALSADARKVEPVIGYVNWREDAACLHGDPDLFFPISMTGPAVDQIDEAKRICRTCPVRKPCLAWALSMRDVAGIWGGTTEAERHAIRGAATRYRMPGVARMERTPTMPTGSVS